MCLANMTEATVESLRPLAKGLTLTVQVVESKVVVDKTKGPKGEGQGLKIAECIVGDATGTIIFKAKNEQVEKAKAGSYVTLSNASVQMFRGSMRLEAGQVEEASGSFKPKTDNCMSLIEFELVSLPESTA